MSQTMEDLVYTRLKKAIIKRYIRPRGQLVEETIARQLGVSRTPVRGAIRRLVYEGFVEIIPHKGAFVIKPTKDEVLWAFEVREILEKHAAAKAAPSVTAELLDELRQCVAEESRVFEQRDVEAYYKINDRFHHAIAEASGNLVLKQYIVDIVSRTTIYLILFDPFYQMEVNPSVMEHSRIIDALATKDAVRAMESMAFHIRSAVEGMELDAFKEQPPDGYIEI